MMKKILKLLFFNILFIFNFFILCTIINAEEIIFQQENQQKDLIVSLSNEESQTDNPEETENVRGEPHQLVHPEDVEGGIVQLEFDFSYISYKDGTASEHNIPFLLRIDTGKNTELRISSAFLEYEKPYFGINDMAVGFKWNFRERNPSMGLLTSVTLPTGSEEFTGDKVSPALIYSISCSINDKWSISANTGWSYSYNSTRDIMYHKGNYGLQICYQINDNNSISTSVGTVYPNNPDGVALMDIALGYETDIRNDIELQFTLSRGLSSIDKGWAFGFGINHRI